MLSEYSPVDERAPKEATELIAREGDHAAYARLVHSGVPDLLARIYAQRGIKSPEEIAPSYERLLPVSSMKGARQAAAYLADCLQDQRRVLIVSDYDCDGATACSVLVMCFTALGMNFDYLVPDRMVHGYGLTPAIVEEAAQLDPRPEVIITVDAGISSHAGIERARELGIEVIVTDHHLAPDTLPHARIIVNPNQPGCTFASKNIAGCGVAWYVARALVEELESHGEQVGFDPAELLSYVAVGTVADVVQLDANNRTMVALGLEYIRRGQCAPGILALAHVADRDPETLSCSDIGFALGPRINAAGRLAHMGAGIECLTTLDLECAQALASHLHITNEERKSIQQEMVTEAVEQASRLVVKSLNGAGADSFGARSIVVFCPEWHEGVVGIVAGRIKEERHRPTIVMTRAQDGNIKGSARSIPGFHLKHALDELNVRYPGILQKFGGHAMAAGMTIAGDKLDAFREAFENICRQHLTPEIMTKRLLTDGALPARSFNVETIREMGLQVWGQGFEEPVFVNDVVVADVKVIGKDKSHLKINGALACDSSHQRVDVMAFGQADYAAEIASAGILRVAFKTGINNFRGRTSLQLLVELLPHQMRAEKKLETAPKAQPRRIGGTPRIQAANEPQSTPALPDLASAVPAPASSPVDAARMPGRMRRLGESRSQTAAIKEAPLVHEVAEPIEPEAPLAADAPLLRKRRIRA